MTAEKVCPFPAMMRKLVIGLGTSKPTSHGKLHYRDREVLCPPEKTVPSFPWLRVNFGEDGMNSAHITSLCVTSCFVAPALVTFLVFFCLSLSALC